MIKMKKLLTVLLAVSVMVSSVPVSAVEPISDAAIVAETEEESTEKNVIDEADTPDGDQEESSEEKTEDSSEVKEGEEAEAAEEGKEDASDEEEKLPVAADGAGQIALEELLGGEDESALEVTVEGASLLLEGTIKLRFWFDLSNINGGGNYNQAEIKMKNLQTGEMLFDGELAQYLGDGAGEKEVAEGVVLTYFDCPIPAQRIYDEISVTLYDSEGKKINLKKPGDGGCFENQTLTYSVKDYLDSIDGDAEQITLFKSFCWFLNYYGRNAKQYFSQSSDGLEEMVELEDVTTDMLSGYQKSAPTGSVRGLQYRGTSLLLKADTRIRHYFTMAEGVDADTYSVTALDSVGGDAEYEISTKDGCLCVDIVNIPAHMIGKPYTLTVRDDQQNSWSIQYSALSYAYDVISSSDTDPSLKELSKALYWYYVSAGRYFGFDVSLQAIPQEVEEEEEEPLPGVTPFSDEELEAEAFKLVDTNWLDYYYPEKEKFLWEDWPRLQKTALLKLRNSDTNYISYPKGTTKVEVYKYEAERDEQGNLVFEEDGVTVKAEWKYVKEERPLVLRIYNTDNTPGGVCIYYGAIQKDGLSRSEGKWASVRHVKENNTEYYEAIKYTGKWSDDNDIDLVRPNGDYATYEEFRWSTDEANTYYLQLNGITADDGYLVSQIGVDKTFKKGFTVKYLPLKWADDTTGQEAWQDNVSNVESPYWLKKDGLYANGTKVTDVIPLKCTSPDCDHTHYFDASRSYRVPGVDYSREWYYGDGQQFITSNEFRNTTVIGARGSDRRNYAVNFLSLAYQLVHDYNDNNTIDYNEWDRFLSLFDEAGLISVNNTKAMGIACHTNDKDEDGKEMYIGIWRANSTEDKDMYVYYGQAHTETQLPRGKGQWFRVVSKKATEPSTGYTAIYRTYEVTNTNWIEIPKAEEVYYSYEFVPNGHFETDIHTEVITSSKSVTTDRHYSGEVDHGLYDSVVTWTTDSDVLYAYDNPYEDNPNKHETIHSSHTYQANFVDGYLQSDVVDREGYAYIDSTSGGFAQERLSVSRMYGVNGTLRYLNIEPEQVFSEATKELNTTDQASETTGDTTTGNDRYETVAGTVAAKNYANALFDQAKAIVEAQTVSLPSWNRLKATARAAGVTYEAPLIAKLGDQYLGIYGAYDDNTYYIYYGKMNGSYKRDGQGKWMTALTYTTTYESGASAKVTAIDEYSGSWSNDRPNGSFTENYQIRIEKPSYTAMIVRSYAGNVTDGAFDGTVAWKVNSTVCESGKDAVSTSHSYKARFREGIIQGYQADQTGYVYVPGLYGAYTEDRIAALKQYGYGGLGYQNLISGDTVTYTRK